MIKLLCSRLPFLALLLSTLSTSASPVVAGLFSKPESTQVEIVEPYIELRSGAGRGYPVLHVEERGNRIEILKRKTDWFKVRTASGREGWVSRDQLQRTLTESGAPMDIRDATLKEFSFYRWEIGAMGGDFEDADVVTVYAGFALTPNFSVEASASKLFADFSDADMADISLSIHPFPGWRFSPFFSLGTGVIRVDAKTTLVEEPDRTDQLGHVGAGVRVYLARRFVFRAQYKNYVIFQSTDDNQEVDEWKAGFSVFF
ncbi:MAG: SH3 domain-containing protein [Gammaproteobacteria bacterium]